MEFLNIICPVNNCDHLSDEEFKKALTESSNQILLASASYHGANAYRIFGNSIASATVEIDRDPGQISTVSFQLRCPTKIPVIAFLEDIEMLWNKTVLSTGEFYDDYRFTN